MKIGIEIHQRLDTNKLFCSCPSILSENDETADYFLTRKLHPVFSEMGEIDYTSKKEFEKNIVFEYQLFSKSNCLVESDEEPPHQINKKALNIAIELSNKLNMRIVDEIHIMRKIVIDGSNTSGFQRTAIISMNGWVETSKGNVRITSLALEEESAGIVGNEEGKRVYRLDRLGIPLVEITTEPDIIDEAHLKETAEKIGWILRETGKVMRGIGTIRQDVNISIEGGERVEIKGVQDLKLLPTYAKNEVMRQTKLIELNKKLVELSKKNDFSKINIVDITNIFTNTKSKLISNGLKKNEKILAIKLSNYSGILGIELQNGRRYGSELSDYSKGAGVKGIIHSDEDLSRYKISNEEIDRIKNKLGAKNNDAFVIVVAKEKIGRTALGNVILRLKIITIPKETRRANKDGTTSYMRPIAGGARMYPETDVPSIEITKKYIEEIKKHSSEGIEKKREKLEKILNKEMAKNMLKSKNLKLFETFVALGFEPMYVAGILENTIVALRREGIYFLDLEKVLNELFSAYNKKLFVKSATEKILEGISKGKTIEEVLNKSELHKIKGDDLRKIAEKYEYNVGRIMKEYRLKIDPKDIFELKQKSKLKKKK